VTLVGVVSLEAVVLVVVVLVSLLLEESDEDPSLGSSGCDGAFLYLLSLEDFLFFWESLCFEGLEGLSSFGGLDCLVCLDACELASCGILLKDADLSLLSFFVSKGFLSATELGDDTWLAVKLVLGLEIGLGGF
jgi:hypothetical protein